MLGHSGDTSVYVAPTSELESLGAKALSACGVGCRANQEDPDFAFSAHCVRSTVFLPCIFSAITLGECLIHNKQGTNSLMGKVLTLFKG